MEREADEPSKSLLANKYLTNRRADNPILGFYREIGYGPGPGSGRRKRAMPGLSRTCLDFPIRFRNCLMIIMS